MGVAVFFRIVAPNFYLLERLHKYCKNVTFCFFIMI